MHTRIGRTSLAALALLMAADGFAATAKTMTLPPNARWQYQLEGNTQYPATGGINVDICVTPYSGGSCVKPQVFDIDLYAASSVSGNNNTQNTAAVSAIHARGGYAICYVDAGSIENFRPDYQQYVDWDKAHGHSLIGKPFSARFPNENWLNINNDQGQRDFLLQKLGARLDNCVAAGFDAVEFDNVDAYANGALVTGFAISAATQLSFDQALAALAHQRGLAAGLKNDLGQAATLQPSFEFAVNEQCYQYQECQTLVDSFVAHAKPVYEVEYTKLPFSFCKIAPRDGINAIKKSGNYSLFATPYKPCT